MRKRRRQFGCVLFGLALAAATGCNGRDLAELRQQIDECNQKLSEQAKTLSDRNSALADCTTDLAKCRGGVPPGGTPIIIEPGGGGNGNIFTIGSSTAQPTLTGLQLNDRAFGTVDYFRGRVVIGAQEYQRDLVSISAKFGAKTLTVERSSTTPEVFVWKLDNVPMTMATGQPESAWNDALCAALSGSVSVVAKKPGGGTESASGVRIELLAN